MSEDALILCECCDEPASRMLMTGPPSGRRFLCEPHGDDPGAFARPRPENDRLREFSREEAVTAMRKQSLARGLLSKRRFKQLEKTSRGW